MRLTAYALTIAMLYPIPLIPVPPAVPPAPREIADPSDDLFDAEKCKKPFRKRDRKRELPKINCDDYDWGEYEDPMDDDSVDRLRWLLDILPRRS